MGRAVRLGWIYQGDDPAQRFRAIADACGDDLELVVVGNAHARKVAELHPAAVIADELSTLAGLWRGADPGVRALVLWVDDGKRANPRLPLEIAMPVGRLAGVVGPAAPVRHLHYWDGNALALSREVAETTPLVDIRLREGALLATLSDIVERRLSRDRLKVLCSPLERFATTAAEPVCTSAS